MLSTRNSILAVTAIVIAGHIYSSTVEAQLFRRNRRCKTCCQQPCCPAPPKCCAPVQTCPTVSCCPGTVSAPMVNSVPAYNSRNQWMAAPNDCNVWITDPNNPSVIDNPSVIEPQTPDDGGGDGRPKDQTCLDLYTECMGGCGSCTGEDLKACRDYCSAKRNNCNLPPKQQIALPPVPACYQTPGVDPGI